MIIIQYGTLRLKSQKTYLTADLAVTRLNDCQLDDDEIGVGTRKD